MSAFHVVTFGCQMNSHDSERMAEVLLGAGHRQAQGVQDADIILLNTCSIREKAEQKLRSEVGRLALLKRHRPGLILGVAGCVAQQEGERLLRSMPQVDLIVGPDNIAELPGLLAEAERGAPPRVRTVFDLDEPRFLQAAPEAGRVGPTAFVTIMKGCNERCSFCIVPTTRGPERYRGSDEILGEVQRFVAAGVREVTLLGQTVNSYRDPGQSLAPAPLAGEGVRRWGTRAAADETEFPALLRAIAHAAPGLARLRYTSPTRAT
jgi:tRNA-2-methylthio-N6-dimethylallyladenosine synthase